MRQIASKWVNFMFNIFDESSCILVGMWHTRGVGNHASNHPPPHMMATRTCTSIVENALSLLDQWKDVPILDEDSAEWLSSLFDAMESDEQRLRVVNQYPLRFEFRTDRDRPWEKLYYLKCDTMPYSWRMSRFMFAVGSWNPNPR